MSQDGGKEEIRKPVSDGNLDYAIVAALAEATDRPVKDVPPLHESIDFDALEAIVLDGSTDSEIEFEHVGHTVAVRDGAVVVSAE